jgi:hypothetical protein
MQLDNLIAIDVHTHAEVSCRQARGERDDRAASLEGKSIFDRR